MSVTIQGNTSTVISNNSAPEGTSEIAKITRQIQVLTEKLGKISSEEGMTTQQKKEMAALVTKQSERPVAQLAAVLRQRGQKKA
ncbi:hypothetical protein HmCmsJML025_01203 [Escherichia coli]|nr:hypothetical protein HmCmsJML025_01203 [Escherichia coli]